MKLRTQFHLILYCFPLFIIFLSIFLLALNLPGVVILLLLGILFCCYIIMLNSFRCPKCHEKFISFYSLFSKYYNGFHYFLPKNCKNCGIRLDDLSKDFG